MAVTDELLTRFKVADRERELLNCAHLGEAARTGRATVDKRWLAKRIEHAVLEPQATEADVVKGARVALRWGVGVLVVKPYHLKAAARLLTGTDVLPVTVVGFPHGGETTETKVAEARQAVAEGAQEIDIVLNIAHLKQHRAVDVFHEIRSVVGAAGDRRVKVIKAAGGIRTLPLAMSLIHVGRT